MLLPSTYPADPPKITSWPISWLLAVVKTTEEGLSGAVVTVEILLVDINREDGDCKCNCECNCTCELLLPYLLPCLCRGASDGSRCGEEQETLALILMLVGCNDNDNELATARIASPSYHIIGCICSRNSCCGPMTIPGRHIRIHPITSFAVIR